MSYLFCFTADALQSQPLLPVIPGALSTTEFTIIIVIFGGGGCALLALAILLAGIFVVLIKKKGSEEADTISEPSPPEEPAMAQDVNEALNFSTGKPRDSEEDEIATEIFVRTPSLPPDEVETMDDQPGRLLAQAVKKKD